MLRELNWQRNSQLRSLIRRTFLRKYTVHSNYVQVRAARQESSGFMENNSSCSRELRQLSRPSIRITGHFTTGRNVLGSSSMRIKRRDEIYATTRADIFMEYVQGGCFASTRSISWIGVLLCNYCRSQVFYMQI